MVLDQDISALEQEIQGKSKKSNKKLQNFKQIKENPYSRVFNTWSACPDFGPDF